MMGHNIWRCELCGTTMMAGGLGAHMHYKHKISGLEHKGRIRLYDRKVVARWIGYRND